MIADEGLKLLVISRKQWRHELTCAPAVNVRSADGGTGAEIFSAGLALRTFLSNVRNARPLTDVILPFFILPSCAGVVFLRPEKRVRLCVRVPVAVGSGALSRCTATEYTSFSSRHTKSGWNVSCGSSQKDRRRQAGAQATRQMGKGPTVLKAAQGGNVELLKQVLR